MARIWLPATGGQAAPEAGAEIPLFEAIRLFELQPKDFEVDAAPSSGFAEHGVDLWPAERRHTMVEVGHTEGEQARWKPGLYKSRILLQEARARLIRYVLISRLGADNVVRIELQPTTDYEGRDALKVTIVITPGATGRLKDRVLDASVALRRCLHAMGDNRFPITEYATEAELAEDGDPQS